MTAHPNKTIVVTGGNSGLGYHCTRNIAAKPDWHIILACRNPQKATTAAKTLTAITRNPCIEIMTLDLASLASIRTFAQNLATRDLPPLRALLCNAGLQTISGTSYTQDGFETTFAVNHLGHFLLTNLLLRQLLAPARIVFVSSGTHDPAQRTGMAAPQYRHPSLLAHPAPHPQDNPGTLGRRYYTTSKLCNVYCTYELSRRLQTEGHSTPERPITVNAFDPGLMPGSGLARDYSLLQRFLWHFILPIFTRFSSRINTPAASGQALARLILDPELENISSQYFAGQQAIPSSAESYDLEKAAELWHGSAELVKLAAHETILR